MKRLLMVLAVTLLVAGGIAVLPAAAWMQASTALDGAMARIALWQMALPVIPVAGIAWRRRLGR